MISFMLFYSQLFLCTYSFLSVSVIQGDFNTNQTHFCSMVQESSNDEPDVAVGMRLMVVKSLKLPVDLHRNTRKTTIILAQMLEHRPRDICVTQLLYSQNSSFYPLCVNCSRRAKTNEGLVPWNNSTGMWSAVLKCFLMFFFKSIHEHYLAPES